MIAKNSLKSSQKTPKEHIFKENCNFLAKKSYKTQGIGASDLIYPLKYSQEYLLYDQWGHF